MASANSAIQRCLAITRTRPKTPSHARHRQPHHPHRRPRDPVRRQRQSAGRAAHRPGRAQRRGQIDAVQGDPGRVGARRRRCFLAARLEDRRRGAGSARRTEVSLVDTVLAADTERARLAGRRPKARPTPHRMGEIYDRLEAIDAYSAPARAAAISGGPGLLGRGTAAPLRANSPAAGACAWRWRRSCSRRPICCCSTSPPTISISKGVLWLEEFLLALSRHHPDRQPRPRSA